MDDLSRSEAKEAFEAYTEQHMSRREDRIFLKLDIAPLELAEAAGQGLNEPEAHMKRSLRRDRVETAGVHPKAWHVCRETLGT